MYELIVVGAGIAGCVTAKKAAEKGIEVLLLDKRPLEEIGNNWTNGVEKSVFKKVKIAPPGSNELALPHKRYRLLSPGGEYVELPEVPMYEINMRPFTRRLLDEAIKAGVEFRDNALVSGPYLRDDKIHGVIVDGEPILAAIVMDASGYNAAIRNNLPRSSIVPIDVYEQIKLTAYRGQIRIEDDSVDVPSILGIPSDITISYGAWRGGFSILSICWHSSQRALDILIGFDSTKYNDTAKECFDSFLKEHGLKGEFVYGGGGPIPIRRSIDVIVDDAFLTAGDAACMVIPIHGSGVASSMIAGNAAAKAVVGCIKTENVGKDVLWNYAVEYQRGRGAMMAFFDVMRMSLEILTPEETDRLVGSVMTPEDIISGLEARLPKINLFTIIFRIKSLRHPKTVMRLFTVGKVAYKVKSHYKKYPRFYSARRLKRWQSELNRILAPIKMIRYEAERLESDS